MKLKSRVTPMTSLIYVKQESLIVLSTFQDKLTYTIAFASFHCNFCLLVADVRTALCFAFGSGGMDPVLFAGSICSQSEDLHPSLEE